MSGTILISFTRHRPTSRAERQTASIPLLFFLLSRPQVNRRRVSKMYPQTAAGQMRRLCQQNSGQPPGRENSRPIFAAPTASSDGSAHRRPSALIQLDRLLRSFICIQQSPLPRTVSFIPGNRLEQNRLTAYEAVAASLHKNRCLHANEKGVLCVILS